MAGTYDVENTLWQSNLFCALGDDEGGEGCFFRRLEDECVARDEGGCDFHGRHRDRNVPGNDGSTYAVWLAERDVDHVGGVERGVAADGEGVSCEVPHDHESGSGGEIVVGWLAHRDGVGVAEEFDLAFHGVGEFGDPTGTLLSAEFRPCWKSGFGGGDGGVDVF